jgi:hypothetical protein
MTRACLLLCALSFGGAACDLEVPSGQTTVLGSGVMVAGVNTPNGVVVREGGILIVEGADVSGRSGVFEEFDDILVPPGAAIVSDGGSISVVDGRVSGGNAFFVPNDPNTPAIVPPGGGLPVRRQIPPAIVATRSVVDIAGGQVTSGGAFGGPPMVETFARAPAVSATASDVRIRGGEFRAGPGLTFRITVFRALESDVQISGGSFMGFANLAGSRSRISGGQVRWLMLGFFGDLADPNPRVNSSGCTEIHGGSLSTVSMLVPSETLFVFGTEFNHPLGRLPITNVSRPGFSGPGTMPPSAEVTGVLADGTPLDLDVFAESLPANVVLAAPGTPGCAP